MKTNLDKAVTKWEKEQQKEKEKYAAKVLNLAGKLAVALVTGGNVGYAALTLAEYCSELYGYTKPESDRNDLVVYVSN